jgi:hypothetical protein
MLIVTADRLAPDPPLFKAPCVQLLALAAAMLLARPGARMDATGHDN